LLLALRRLSIEVFVGFIGVYAAFALAAYKDRRDLTDRRHQLKRALIAEITPLLENDERNLTNGGYKHIAVTVDSAIKAGKKVIPPPLTEPVGLNMDLWEAAKQSGGLTVMDVPTFVKVSQFYNNWSTQMVYYSQLRDVSINIILPNADRGPSAFYDARTGALRRDVSFIYFPNLLSLDRLANEGVKLGKDVIAQLAKDTI